MCLVNFHIIKGSWCWKDALGILWSNISVQSGPPGVSYQGPCPDGFWLDLTASLGNLLLDFNLSHEESLKFQCGTIVSFPVAGYHWREPGSTCYAPLLQVFIRYLLKLYISSLNSPSSLRLPQWRDASVIPWSWWLFSGLSLVCPCLSCSEEPKLDSALQAWLHQCWRDGHDHFLQPAGTSLSNMALDMTCFPCHKGSSLAHVKLAVHQDSQVLFRKTAFQTCTGTQGSSFPGEWFCSSPFFFLFLSMTSHYIR